MSQIDARIALGFQPQTQLENPTNALAKMMQIQGLQQQNQLGQMKMDEYRTAGERRNKLAELASPEYASARDRANAYMRGGFHDEAKSILEADRADQKSSVELEDKRFKLANERYATYKKSIGALLQRPDLSKDLVVQAGQELVAVGVLPADMYQQAIANLPDDPVSLRARLQEGVASQLSAEKQFEIFAPKPTEIKDGQQIMFRDMNPNSPTYGQNTGGAPVQMQMTPGEMASNATTRRGQDMVDARGRQANDLKAREIDLIGQPASGGPVLGAPVPAVLPWANQSNPKDANKVKALEQSRGAKEIEKDIDAARKERDAAAQARRFIELNEKTATGGLVDRMGITRGLQSLGPEYAEMEAITAKLAPAMRVEGSGSTSDFDGKQFERATVGVDKPKAANKNIAQGVIARAQQAEEYADFRQTYLEQNGTLQGADRFWKDYANKNPIFDPEKAGTFELNAKRKPWKEHFKTQPVKGGPSPKPSPNMGEGGIVDFGSLK